MAKPWERFQSNNDTVMTIPNSPLANKTAPWERQWVRGPQPTDNMTDEEIDKWLLDRIEKSRKLSDAKKTMGTFSGAMRTSAERILNSASFGGYGALNNALGGNFDERNKVGQENIRNAGWGGKLLNSASNLANDVAAGAPLGAGIYNAAGKVTTRTLPRLMLSSAAGGGLYSGLNSRGSLKNRAENAAAGAAIGAITAPIIYGAQKGISAAFDKAAEKVSTSHASAKYKDVAGDINKIADDTDAFRAVKRGIKADDDVARLVRDQTDDVLSANSDKVSVGVAKVLDKSQANKTGQTVAKNLEQVRETYGDFMKEYGHMPVDKRELAAVIKKNPEITRYIKDAQTHGPTTGMPENSFGVLHEANRRMKLDLRDRMVNSSSKLQDKSYASGALDKLLDRKFGGRDYIDKAFRRSKLKFDLIDAVNTAKTGESSNFAGKLLTREMKQQVAELYGPETADELSKYLRDASRSFDNIKGLNNAARTKLREIGVEKRPFWREAVESVGSIIGSVGDAATAGYRRRMNTNLANRILTNDIGQATKIQASPFLSMLLATHNAGITPDSMDTLRKAEQDLKDLPLSINGLNTAGSDRYYHERGQYENAQKGIENAYNSQMVGLVKEVLNDLPRNVARGKGVGVSLSDALQDLTYNINGGINGLYNKTPADKNKYLDSTKTKDMYLLEQVLKGIK